MKISVSKINDFLNLKNDKPFITMEDFNNTIKGIRKTKFEASRGTAIHELLEEDLSNYYCAETNSYTVQADDQTFTFSVKDDATLISHILNIKTRYKGAISEIPMSLDIDTRFGPLKISMRIDGLFGSQLLEYKTTKSFNHSTYKESLQWQLYLLATGLDVINYEVIQLSKKPMLYSFSFTRHDINHKEIHDIIDELLEYLDTQNLMSYIQN